MAPDKSYEANLKRLLDEAEAPRLRFSRSLRALSDARIPYHDRAPELPQRVLDTCRLLQSRDELARLLPKDGVVAEIGNDRGAFVRLVLDTCLPRQLHLFKHDSSRVKSELISEGLRQGTIIIHEGDPASLVPVMPDDYFDWMYLDNGHFYEDVSRDIKMSAARIKPGGYLVINDYTTWSPVSANRCGVARAVNEFCIANQWEVAFLALQSLTYNDIALRKPTR